ncbi:uncharacterized protein PV09_08101 [Verruconis gallopava]|uniref:DUF7730 domain-containing protein n=1 Tax=Verruconis gallopava TaxID=253628 RepID=A0A0D1YHQ3_9PEZI|nr:uncharacterized protein PV09_08101 [Verruconis gallopava]KIW00392.1 hypothetical protein PV09_08101 [Verruconis gallopava]
MSGQSTSQTMSRLLSLPPELRKQIWDHLLAPNTTTKLGENDDSAVTAVSRTCSSITYFMFGMHHARPHELDDSTCSCLSRSFYIHHHGAAEQKVLCPAILRVSRQVHDEALPSLYERRTFTADPNRTFMSLWDRSCETWFLFDRFLQGLPECARRHVRSIRLPMLLSRYEVQGARQAFYSIASRLPNLATVEIEFSPSAVRETWIIDDGDVAGGGGGSNAQIMGLHGFFDARFDSQDYFLGPVMAFAHTRLVVTAVDRQDIARAVFERLKPHIEMRVWRQLLPARVKREQRKIARIKRALGALEYDEVDALEQGSLLEAACGPEQNNATRGETGHGGLILGI